MSARKIPAELKRVARSGGRLAAVQALYQMEQSGQSGRSVIRDFMEDRLGMGPEGVPIFEQGLACLFVGGDASAETIRGPFGCGLRGERGGVRTHGRADLGGEHEAGVVGRDPLERAVVVRPASDDVEFGSSGLVVDLAVEIIEQQGLGAARASDDGRGRPALIADDHVAFGAGVAAVGDARWAFRIWPIARDEQEHGGWHERDHGH